MSSEASLEINGELRRYPDGKPPATVMQLLRELDVDPARIVAEVNGEVVSRRDFEARALADGDTVELVRFVGGG